MRDKIAALATKMRESQVDHIERAEKVDSEYARGIEDGYADALGICAGELESILQSADTAHEAQWQATIALRAADRMGKEAQGGTTWLNLIRSS